MQKAGPSGIQLIKKTITVAVLHTSIKRNLQFAEYLIAQDNLYKKKSQWINFKHRSNHVSSAYFSPQREQLTMKAELN